LKQAVTAIFVSGDKIYVIKRQDYLKAFPGYTAFPGGKVEDSEAEGHLKIKFIEKYSPKVMRGLIREINEELGYDLKKGIEIGEVVSFSHIGNAVTPEFNQFRFDTHFYKIVLSNPFPFEIDLAECSGGFWARPSELLESFKRGELLMVPPTYKAIAALAENIHLEHSIDLNLNYDAETMVPYISPIYGITNFFPLSNTFPPAIRTNSFLIGDYLIDPSPKNKEELAKLINSLKDFNFKAIFLTHHHPDHHEFSTEIARLRSVPMAMSKLTFDMILAKFGADYFKDIKVEYFKEGDILTQCAGKDIYVFEVPGHDEGQLALAPKTMEWFLVGDLIQTVGTVVIGKPEGDMSKYFASLKRVISLDPKIVIPSHGISVGGTFKLKETLKHRQMREGQVIELLREGKTSEEMLSIIYKDLDINLLPYARKTIECHVEKIKKEKLDQKKAP
jgi:endoribonuclease LACTB2